MGKEIELKVPVSDKEYSELKDKYFSDSKLVIKIDEYFSKYNSIEERIKNNEPSVIRIRSEKIDDEPLKSFFTIKTKKKENGIEINKEDETFIEDSEVLRTFFIEAGYHKWFEKEKSAFGCYKKSDSISEIDFHMELVIVNNMKYLEVEVTDSKGYSNSVIQNELEHLIESVGLDPSKKDIRSWYELIEGRK